MKPNPSPILIPRKVDLKAAIILACLMSVGSVPAGEEPDWKSIAKDAQSALVRLNTTVGNYLIHNTGFFVSQHGHLLCNLGAIANATRPPELLDSQGKTLPFGSISAVFPDAQIVILKLDHRPKKWLVLSNQPVQSGTEVAFLGPNQIPPEHIGPVLARRTTRACMLRGIPFNTVLSIGTHPPRNAADGTSSLTTGNPLVDRDGRVIGIYHGIVANQWQTLSLAYPIDLLSNAVQKAVSTPDKIRFPLPPELDPYDPATRSQDYLLAAVATEQGANAKALEHVARMLEIYPASPLVRQYQFHNLEFSGRKEECRKLFDDLAQPGKDPGFDRISLLEYRSKFELHELKFDAAIATLQELAGMTPRDYPLPFYSLGDCYRMKGDRSGDRADYLEAEKWYAAAAKIIPEDTEMLTHYEQVLAKLNRWEECTALSERIFKLEALYRRR